MDMLFIHPDTHDAVFVKGTDSARKFNPAPLLDGGYKAYELAFRTTVNGQRPFLDKLKINEGASTYVQILKTAVFETDE